MLTGERDVQKCPKKKLRSSFQFSVLPSLLYSAVIIPTPLNFPVTKVKAAKGEIFYVGWLPLLFFTFFPEQQMTILVGNFRWHQAKATCSWLVAVS